MLAGSVNLAVDHGRDNDPDRVAGDEASALANLIEILGFGVAAPGAVCAGLIALVKRIRGRQVKKVEIIDNEQVRITVEGEEIVIRRKLADVFNDLRVRRALEAVLAPLLRPDVDTFEVRAPDGSALEQVTTTEIAYFQAPTPEPAATERIIRNELSQAFTIEAVTFKEGNKWRLSDGGHTMSVTIEDPAFLADVNSGVETFAKGDTILCTVRQEQTVASDGTLKTEWAVTSVREHRRAARQTVMSFSEPTDPEG